jgi:hypothetical protein
MGEEGTKPMNAYVIERKDPGVGGTAPDELQGGPATSGAAPAEFTPEVRWLTSHVAQDETFRVYLPARGADVRQHAERPGFPAHQVTEVTGVIDPTTEDT